MTTIAISPSFGCKKIKGIDRHAVHRHADEYLKNIEIKKVLSNKSEMRPAKNILGIFAKNFVLGLETMFNSLQIKV